jgi:hypothetical protein
MLLLLIQEKPHYQWKWTTTTREVEVLASTIQKKGEKNGTMNHQLTKSISSTKENQKAEHNHVRETIRSMQKNVIMLTKNQVNVCMKNGQRKMEKVAARHVRKPYRRN